MKTYPPGAWIAGRYEVAGRPLVGGMGEVYLCLDLETIQPYTLKTFQQRYLQSLSYHLRIKETEP